MTVQGEKTEKRVERKGGDPWELRRFHTSQLIEELARRQNEAPCAKPEHWCHDCDNFVAWNDRPRKGEMPDSFNACTKGHTMKFVAPEDFDDEYGFYLAVCRDRSMPAAEPGRDEAPSLLQNRARRAPKPAGRLVKVPHATTQEP